MLERPAETVKTFNNPLGTLLNGGDWLPRGIAPIALRRSLGKLYQIARM